MKIIHECFNLPEIREKINVSCFIKHFTKINDYFWYAFWLNNKETKLS
jgi:hypothetical protein